MRKIWISHQCSSHLITSCDGDVMPYPKMSQVGGGGHFTLRAFASVGPWSLKQPLPFGDRGESEGPHYGFVF